MNRSAQQKIYIYLNKTALFGPLQGREFVFDGKRYHVMLSNFRIVEM